MKIQLIYPTKLDQDGNPKKYKKAFLPPLSLAILNGLTPPQHELRVVNDVVEQIDFSDSYDLVAITSLTAQIPRAYQIADRFRRMGTKVIIGGIHATVLPEEAKEHADSVVIGEADSIWEQILSDFETNDHREFYKDSSFPDLQRLLIPRWDNMNMKIYAKPLGQRYPMMPVYTTRGCVFDCKFCSVSRYFGRTYRMKPISNVLKELDALDASNIFFVDDNIACNADYSRELFRALGERKITWFSQISTTVLKNPDLIDLAGKSGCNFLLIGIESIGNSNLESVNKSFNKPEHYEELFARLRAAGIGPIATIIFGFDDDTPEIYKSTIDFLVKHKVNAYFSLLTPLPGTRLYDEMKAEGRITVDDWPKYDASHIVFQPKNSSVDELFSNFWQASREFYSFKNIAKRLAGITSISRRPFGQFFESLFYLLFSRKNVYSYEHPLADGILRVGN